MTEKPGAVLRREFTRACDDEDLERMHCVVLAAGACLRYCSRTARLSPRWHRQVRECTLNALSIVHGDGIPSPHAEDWVQAESGDHEGEARDSLLTAVGCLERAVAQRQPQLVEYALDRWAVYGVWVQAVGRPMTSESVAAADDLKKTTSAQCHQIINFALGV